MEDLSFLAQWWLALANKWAVLVCGAIAGIGIGNAINERQLKRPFDWRLVVCLVLVIAFVWWAPLEKVMR